MPADWYRRPADAVPAERCRRPVDIVPAERQSSSTGEPIGASASSPVYSVFTADVPFAAAF